MASVVMFSPGKSSGSSLRAILAFGAIVLAGSGLTAGAKEPSLTAIELYDGASGPAYVQLADVLINGKAELRSCAGAESGPIEKSAYNKFPKLGMAPGGVLERGSDGVMRYGTGGGQAACVVPENIKFEHNASFTAAAMADSADLRARAVAAGSDGSATRLAAQKGRESWCLWPPPMWNRLNTCWRRGSGTSPDGKATSPSIPPPRIPMRPKRCWLRCMWTTGEKALSAYQKSGGDSVLRRPEECLRAT